jgi:N-acetylglutamate synthase-like GNAT family acetyltransferase
MTIAVSLELPGARDPKYDAKDLDACRQLWEQLNERHRRIYENDSIGGDDPGQHFDEHLGGLGQESIWIAELDGDVVGFAGLIVDDPTAELEPIVVAERLRSRGIGRALAEEVIGRARELGIRQVVVQPVARNTEAIRFFHGLGFDALGQLELMLDLVPEEQRWRPGERIAQRGFRF